MALSPHLAKALEQTKMNLHMLRGAAYFTEKQWVHIDYWVNREQYVWTNGPQESVLEDEVLLSFEEPTKEFGPTDPPTNSNLLNSKVQAVVITSETEVSSSAFVDLARKLDTPLQTPSGISAESFSDEETTVTVPRNPTTSTTLVNEPLAVEATNAPQPEPVQASRPGGLPPGITQAQLDEAKAFKSSWTVKYDSSDSKISSPKGRRKLAPVAETVQTGHPSPMPSEQDSQIQSWASTVSKPSVSAPAPMNIHAKPFVQGWGREPEAINHEFRPPTTRPSSTTSNLSRRIPNSPSIARPSSGASNISGKYFDGTKIHSGMILKARTSQANKKSAGMIEVQVGDDVKVYKIVSDRVFSCRNLRTKFEGNVEARVFMSPGAKPEKAVQQQYVAVQTPKQRAVSQSIVHTFGVDGFEAANATEWDEVPISSRQKKVTLPPKPKVLSGLKSSRFAVLADEDASQSDEGGEQDVAMLRDKVSEMVDAKIEQILATRGDQNLDNVLSRAPSRMEYGGYSRVLVKDPPFQPPPPKTVTCWFWHFQHANPHRDGCRYKDEDCWNLHHYPHGVANAQFPLKNGKATWGALSDAELAETPPHKAPFTCWYWATRGQCSNSADTCKYMHANVIGGVAARPRRTLGFFDSRDGMSPWSSSENVTWDPTEDQDDSEQKENQSPEAEAMMVTGWETEEDGKPNFVRELEDKADKESEAIW